MQFCDILHLADTANSNMTTGVNIQQGTADTEIFALKSSDVDHGMTNFSETDNFADFRKNAALGGLHMRALMDETGGANVLRIEGFSHDDGNTTKSSSGRATIELAAARMNGVSRQGLQADSNIFGITNGATGASRFLFDLEGTFHADVASTTYDDYCDIELLRGVLAETVPCYRERFGQDMMYNLCDYTDMKLIGKDSVHWEQRDCGKLEQRAMINFTSLAMLHHSTIIQLADRFNTRLDGIETQLKALTEGK